jgi:uncharacterized protein (TIGR02145 family)
MKRYLCRTCSQFQVLVLAVFTAFSGCSDGTDKLLPEITWANPSPIAQGTPLSTAQLNATASVKGMFTYTPPEGTVLPEGANQILSVEFKPDDATKYSGAQASVQLSVNSPSTGVFNTSVTYGSLTDQQGNVYKTVTIGEQTWMAENLRTTIFRNGESIPEVKENPEWKNLTRAAYCNYGNEQSAEKTATNGRLYNWFAVSDVRAIAPAGWHVATDADWKNLTNALGGESVAGGKLKEAGNTHWKAPNTSATNSSGFTAQPAGRREYTDGSFINSGFNAFWWTSSPYNPDYSWYRQVNYDAAFVNPANFHKQYGFSVRCVKD